MDPAPSAVDAAVETLSAPQREAWATLSTERLIRILCGRQAGKTFLIALWLLVGGLARAGSINVYLALTKESAKRAIWPELLAVGRLLGIDEGCFRLHGGIVTLPNGSTVLVMGTDDKATIETWRGSKLDRVAIDEMGSQSPEWIAYMVGQILWWCIMRHDGAIALLGTPGLVADGYWWEQTRPEATHRVHSWDVYSNHGIPHASDFIDETLRINGWTRETPQFIREVLGKWTRDDAAQVYPYDDKRNGIDALPRTSSTGSVIPASTWRYVVAASLAHSDRVAWVVLASNIAIPQSIVVEASAIVVDPEPGAELLRESIARFPDASVVIDPGELKEPHVMAVRRDHDISGACADRAAKASAIRGLRGAVLSGAVQVLRGTPTAPLRDSWRVLGWNPRKPAHHNPTQVEQEQLASAAAYGYRKIPARAVDPDAHSPTSRQWHETMVEQLRARAARGNSSGIERLQ